MASVTLYDAVVPTLTKGLKTFDHILTKAEEHVKAKGLDADAELPQARLVEDQNPLVFQVQNATRTVKVTLDRLTGKESAPYENTEKTLQDLHARINDALGLLEAADADVINGRGAEQVEVSVFPAPREREVNVQLIIVDRPFGGKNLKFTARDAALNQGVPNFFFHLNTAYSILRAKGVPIGKADYIGSFLGL
jgi:uncharacterized protein